MFLSFQFSRSRVFVFNSWPKFSPLVFSKHERFTRTNNRRRLKNSRTRKLKRQKHQSTEHLSIFLSVSQSALRYSLIRFQAFKKGAFRKRANSFLSVKRTSSHSLNPVMTAVKTALESRVTRIDCVFFESFVSLDSHFCVRELGFVMSRARFRSNEAISFFK